MGILLAIYAVLLRLIPILNNRFSFMYDNAKDSLVMLEMFQYHKPALLGPTTSLEGLFYGPAWYYIALPFNILGQFHPFASVAMVLFLVALSTFVLTRVFGKTTGFLFAVSIGAIGTQNTAWTPYMTTFPMIAVFILLSSMKHQKKISLWLSALLGLFVSLMFHFQVAYAVVFLPLVFLVLIKEKIPFAWKHWCVAFFAFLLPMLPQAFFETRHDFLQTRSVIRYIHTYCSESQKIQPNSSGILRVKEVTEYMFDNAKLSVLSFDQAWIATIVLLFIGISIVKRKKNFLVRTSLTFIVGSFLFYLVLPIKPYYLTALIPVWIILFSQCLQTVSKNSRSFILVSYAVLSVVHLQQGIDRAKQYEKTDVFFLGPKMQAIQTAYEMSEGKPFASYQYVPEIYDYTYQYLYLVGQQNGKQLPTEFSYAAGEYTYIPQKHVQRSTTRPTFTILIVEKPKTNWLYDQWKDRVTKNLEIIETRKINDALTVYKTIPKKL
ncbi:MAG: hypothetical protein HZA34_01470 [Candidatus Pacebacteria bacterium]|nr:hypothetical protein [Candidatus Paceibacterota bacterium]